jgi:hypothetical protein
METIYIDNEENDLKDSGRDGCVGWSLEDLQD